MPELSLEETALLQLLSHSLFNRELTVNFEKVNAQKLFTETKTQTVIAVAFESLPKEFKERDPEVYDHWQRSAFAIMQKNIMQSFANVELGNLLENADIPYCTIKGFASAYYYPKSSLRQMGDIDFLVPKDQNNNGIDLLLKSGFVREHEDSTHSFHVAFRKNKQSYEMHTAVTGFKDADPSLDHFNRQILTATERICLETGSIIIPKKAHHAAIMLLHLRRHMRDCEGIGLRHFCDWAVFANTVTDEEWANSLKPLLNELKIENMAKAFSKAADMYLGMTEHSWFSDFDEETASELLADILSSGNFGRKELAQRQSQKLFIDGRKRGKFKNILFRYKTKVYTWRGFFKRRKIFLPIGCIVYALYVLLLVLFKRKKLNLVKNYQTGSKRSALYNEIFGE